MNNIPYKDIALQDVYKVITGSYFCKVTEQARRIKTRSTEVYKRFKVKNFDYVTFAGTFSYRNKDHLKRLSGLMCFDIDHTHALDALKRYIIKDKYLNAQLIFTSPGGDGLKVTIKNPHPYIEYKESYERVRAYFYRKYGIKPDSTSDISRGCLICYDPEAWILPNNKLPAELQLQKMISKNPMLQKLIDTFDCELKTN